MQDWNKLIKRTGTIDEIGARLDALAHHERVKGVRTMNAGSQARLWEMAEGTEVALEDMVPPEVPPLTPIIHYGKNSLPLLSRFEKRFCLPSEGNDQDVLFGYNEGTIRPVAGPGYFVVRKTPGSSKGSVVIDYYSTPNEKPGSWPDIAPSDFGLPAIIYGFMHDYLRKVSSHVTIGRAFKHHAATNNYFLLCREVI